jgi:anti-anti-sigma factor
MPAVSFFLTEALITASGTILRCAGEVDRANIHLLRDPLSWHLQGESLPLILDLAAVEYMDGAAIVTLIEAAQFLRAQDQRLCVRATHRQMRLFRLLGCQELLLFERGS